MFALSFKDWLAVITTTTREADLITFVSPKHRGTPSTKTAGKVRRPFMVLSTRWAPSTRSKGTSTTTRHRVLSVTCRHVVHSWCTRPETTVRQDGPGSTGDISWQRIITTLAARIISVWTKTRSTFLAHVKTRMGPCCTMFKGSAELCHVNRMCRAENWPALCAPSEPALNEHFVQQRWKRTELLKNNTKEAILKVSGEGYGEVNVNGVKC